MKAKYMSELYIKKSSKVQSVLLWVVVILVMVVW